MTAGTISSRYARALFLLVKESGRGEQVFAQARALLKNPSSAPAPLEDDLVRLVSLLRKNHRTEFMKAILVDFVRAWCKEEGLCIVKMISAVPSDDLAARVVDVIHDHTGRKVLLESSVDPALLGGFVLELDDETLDASVKHQLDIIRSQFELKNKRII